MNKRPSDIELLQELAVEVLDMTERILNLIELQDLDEVLARLDDRNRIINILSILQQGIPTDKIAKEFPQFQGLIAKVCQYDDKITEDLIKLKETVHFEIAKTFKSKENLKGYNLNNIK